MADKTNKTQEDMVENTFADFDQDINTQTSDPHTAEPNGGSEGSATKKKSSNTLLYGGVAVAAVAVVGYMFVKPMLSGSGNQAPVAQTPVAVTPPTVPTPTAAPVASSQPAAPVVASASTPVADQNFLNQNGQNPLAGNRSVPDAASASTGLTSPTPVIAPITPVTPVTPDASASQSSVAPVAPISPVLPASTPDVSTASSAPVATPVNPVAPVTPVDNQANVSPVNGVVGNNNTQQALVEQLKSMFDQQTREIKGSIDAVGERVTNVEKAITDQKDINKSIEDRLSKLESGQTTKSIVAKPRVESSETSSTTQTVRPEHKRVHKAPVRRSTVVKKVEKDDSVLIDKSVAPAQVSSTSSNVAAPANIQIHSVFAGRVWIKNSDSSLSTYVAGERLPTGEIIKRIDDNNGTIVTDKRVIK